MIKRFDPKTYGYRRSNFKEYFETDPETFGENKKHQEELKKKMGWKSKPCGSCNLCCKLPPVPALKKDALEWCKNCEIGVGCKIYKDRPLDCRAFECAYATGMTTEKLKPDEVGFYITIDSPNDTSLGMMKVYTEKHRLASTIRKLKKIRFGIPFFKGFHISFGPEKEDSYLLHEEYEKGANQYYGGKTFEELKEWVRPTLDMLPVDFKEKLIEKAKETW